MNATAEIDGAGRLVIPKKLRDALHLTPGTRLVLREEGNRLIMEPEANPVGLYMKRGFPVYDAGGPELPAGIDWAKEDRERRIKFLLNDQSSS